MMASRPMLMSWGFIQFNVAFCVPCLFACQSSVLTQWYKQKMKSEGTWWVRWKPMAKCQTSSVMTAMVQAARGVHAWGVALCGCVVWRKDMDKCSLCGKVRYCSKVCEVMHRKEFHKYHLFQQPEFIAEGTERQNGLVRQGLHIFQQPEFIEAYREGNRDRQNNLT